MENPASPDESGATPRPTGGFMGRLVGIQNVDGNYKGNPDPPIIMVFRGTWVGVAPNMSVLNI